MDQLLQKDELEKLVLPVSIWEVKINGAVVGLSEDIECLVLWTFDTNFYDDGSKKVLVKDIKEGYGVQSGTDYTKELNDPSLNRHLYDYIEDVIAEMLEV